MINEKQGNVLDIESGIIVHGCNSHGVMGSGIAKEVRARFPRAYQVYTTAYSQALNAGMEGLPLGSVTWAKVGPAKWIVNAVTQKDYGRDPGRVYADYQAMYDAFVLIQENISSGDIDIRSVNFPLIGCGLANGKWEKVSEIIQLALDPEIEKTLWIYTP
jgi:O-acetyl-ADP-ribose deacetylase (regulator of RNase III)